jgi:hypothetical protein
LTRVDERSVRGLSSAWSTSISGTCRFDAELGLISRVADKQHPYIVKNGDVATDWIE